MARGRIDDSLDSTRDIVFGGSYTANGFPHKRCQPCSIAQYGANSAPNKVRGS